jgi:hypothetical protein
MALSEDIAMLIIEMEANVSHLESLTHGLSDAQFNWRPEPGRWSMAECVTHLNIVNGGDLSPLESAIAAGRARNRTGEGPFTYGFLSKKFVATMEPTSGRKFKAPKLYAPPPQAGKDETVKEYGRIATELRRLTKSADGLHLARIKTTMLALPAALRPFVKMPLGARLHLITAHDRRHLSQAEQVRDHPDFPKDGGSPEPR